MAVTKEILESHPVKNLKAELRKVKKSLNYGKLKKPELIELMLKPENIDFFKDIKMFVPPPRKPRKPKSKKEESKKQEPPKEESKPKRKVRIRKRKKDDTVRFTKVIRKKK